MLPWAKRLIVLTVTLAFPLAAHAAEWRGGIGIIGDSYSDEYQFYPPVRSKARNWVEILAANRKLDFGSFTTQSRGEPRNQGFSYNWARSEATTEDVLAQGQHTGLAAQVAAGDVGLVAVFAGGNDFIHALGSSDPMPALEAALPRAQVNLRRIVETILAASPNVKLVLATVPNICDLPEFDEPIRTGSIARETANRATSLVRRFNASLRSMALGNPRIAIADLDLNARIANVVSRDFIPLGGRRIDRTHPGESALSAFLEDRRHAGTVGQALLARVFVQTVNTRFGVGIEPFTDQEILAIAESQAAGARSASDEAGAPPPSARMAEGETGAR
jgi:hypothetical protein